MPTNFDLAPPPVTSGGTTTVPIDVQDVDAHLVFDAATSNATGDASLTFQVGPTAGRPMFDLRQAITGVWLDGAPLAVTSVLTRDLGGEPGAEMKVLDVDVAAGTTHTLRLTYDVGVPSSSHGGSYPPSLTWSPGNRMVWNVGNTDLQPGRYLEAWVPANLIWDQSAIRINVELTGTTVDHTLVTNGATTAVGSNHWVVTYPSSSTALSPLLEVRPTDSLVAGSTTVTMPVSGTTLTIEGWKLAANTALVIGPRLADLAGWLSDDEARIGPYAHGDRFVVFLHQGGMEYDGACTSGVGALRHEAFHSWWGRAVRPASQSDGWFDEGWNTYHDDGGAGATPLSFSDPPVTLCNRNPYSRVTPGASYGGGAAVFEGLAALSSPAAITGWMGEFYAAHRYRPSTTLQLEAHLLARSGQPDTVDAFHRFVYGLPDPAAAPDLWLRDNPGHTGTEHWPGRFWDSPDLWIRRADDGGTAHQDPIAGLDCWFHARVRNRGPGPARHFMVTFQVRQFAGVEFTWPTDFLPAVAATGGFDLAPGDSRVVKARWPASLVPPAGAHACWLAAVLTRGDRPFTGRRVWEHGNLAQKNLTVLKLRPGQRATLPFLISGSGRQVRLELRRSGRLAGLRAGIAPRRPPALASRSVAHILEGALVHERGRGAAGRGGDAERDEKASDARDQLDEDRFDDNRRSEFAARQASTVSVALPIGTAVLGLQLYAPRGMEVGARGVIDLVQRDHEGWVVGGIAVAIEVTEP